MYEAMMTLIPEAVIDLTLNDAEPQRAGNRDRQKAPHGIYPLPRRRHLDRDQRGRRRRDWTALLPRRGACGMAWRCRASPMLEAVWPTSRRSTLRSKAGRAGQRRVRRSDKLQAAGVAAGPVLRCDELLDDDQLQAQRRVVTIDHPIAGPHRQLGLPWRMDSLGVEYRRAPLLGEHTHEILTGLLGIDEADYARLEADGVLS